MTELEQKAEEYIKKFEEQYAFADTTEADRTSRDIFISDAYKDGYTQGQKDYTQFVNDYNSLYGKDKNKCLYNEFAEIKKENAELKEQIEQMKLKTIEAIKNLDNANCEWLPAHNGKAKYIYAQEVIDIIQDMWELANDSTTIAR